MRKGWESVCGAQLYPAMGCWEDLEQDSGGKMSEGQSMEQGRIGATPLF